MQTAVAESLAPTAARSPRPSNANVRDLARRCLSDADGDVRSATEAMIAILTEMTGIVAAAAVGREMRDDRRRIVASAAGMRPEAAQALARVVGRSILDFPLAGGKRLRDATRPEIEAQAVLYADQAREANHRAAWLRAVAALIPDNAKAGDVLDEATATRLFQEAANA